MVDIEDYESKVQLRMLRLEDFEQVVALQLACFPSMSPWTEEQFKSQITHFPEGQLGIEIDGELVASCATLIVDYTDYQEWHDWSSVADGGFIRNHDPDGDTLYGIEIQVHPSQRGKRLARRLYDARKDLCRQHNLARIVIGGRIPGYLGHEKELTAREYAEAVIEARLHDQVLSTQISNGFVLRQIVSEYLPSDEDSAGYATILEWSNLDYAPARARRRLGRAVQTVRVATAQYRMRPISSFEEFAQQVEFFVDTASDYRSDFVCFPELFTLELLSLVKSHRPGTAARELASFTSEYVELFADLSVRYNINIVAGTQFLEEDDRLYNYAHLFRRDGSIARQAKIHATPSEASWWGVQGGDTSVAFDTDCGRIGIAVCYDVQFPELVRKLVDEGARILFVPYNTNNRMGHMRVKTCAQARAIENQMFVVTSGCVGNLPFVDNADIHYAQSGIYTPSDIGFARDGVAAETTGPEETLLVHDLDVELLRRSRLGGTVRQLADRRTDLYEVVWKGPAPVGS